MEIVRLNNLFEEYWKREQDTIFRELGEFLSFQSISAVDQYTSECEKCAEWLCTFLNKVGVDSKVIKTKSKPLVYAEKIQEGKPTLLFYAHYDVQPVGEESQWDSPPFKMTVKGDKFYARGAADDKGQLFYFLKGLEFVLKQNILAFSIKILIEGEEESEGEAISQFIRDNKDILQADILHVCDTGLVQSGDPTIMIGLRGLVQLRIALRGANRELHSGHHGGVAPNPLLGMSKLLSSLVNDDGSIAVEGYYDEVVDISDSSKLLVEKNPFDPHQYELEIGVPPVAGENQYSVAYRVGLRPTIEIHGISGGYNGPGIKTIVPERSEALLSSRLVWGQDPEKCLTLLKRHLQEHCPCGLKIDFLEEGGEHGNAVYVDPHNRWVAKSAEYLKHVTGRQVYFRCNGGSIPVISELSKLTGAVPVLVGFSRDEDRIHATNESFSIQRFQYGLHYSMSFLSQPE